MGHTGRGPRGSSDDDQRPLETPVEAVVMKTCVDCHWWFRFDASNLVGDCVFHNGTKKTPAAKLRFKGTLKTQADFGCVCWENDRRECSVCGNRKRKCLCDDSDSSS